MNKIVIGILLTLVFLVISVSDAKASDCSYWQDIVGVKGVDYRGYKINEKDTETIMEGIRCLLQIEGDKSKGAFSGATHNEVSAILPESTVEICALYYISKLFYGKYDHASGVVLRDEIVDVTSNKRNRNTQEQITKAYVSYRKWFKMVKEIGIEAARKQNLDPLDCTGIRWY